MIEHINYDVDEERLLLEAENFDGYEPYLDPKTKHILNHWLIKRVSTGYGRLIADDFEKILSTKVKPRFYILKKGFELPFHSDRGTTCAINFVLSTSDDAISFRDGDHKYKSAIIDVTQDHAVKAVTEDRYLFKLSIFDKSYDDCREDYVRYRTNTIRA